MSTQRPLPRRMIAIVPENGYESPRSPESSGFFFGNGIHKEGERRRNPFADSEDARVEDTDVEIKDTIAAEDNMEAACQEEQRKEDAPTRRTVGFRDRVGCYTWTWFTMTMATGGIANVLHSIPYRSDWLRILGVIVFLFNIVLFLVNCLFITLRFRWNPGSFRGSFTSPSESLFVPACVVSVGTILINMSQYGISETSEWFQRMMQVFFWAYVALSFLASSGLYLIIWSTQTFPIHTMTPIWIFPAYPLLLMAPFAANLIDALPNSAAAARINAISITFGALCIQGTGFLVSLMIYSAFIYRLMTQKLPRETTRPGMFVSVGPSGFTVAGLVHLGNTVTPKVMPSGFQGNTDAAFVIKLLSDLAGLWMWGLCLWFFVVSVGAHWQVMPPRNPEHHIQFDMTWYLLPPLPLSHSPNPGTSDDCRFSFVFPNTALVTATQALGKSLNSDGLKIFGTVMAVLLVVLWFFVFGMMIRALWLRRLLWPGEIDGAKASRRRWIAKMEDAAAKEQRS
ncbi:related to C4-dicarboxylate transport protein mae1 [Phialocephala subalpina]|uniref:Related to C4-dicarboxylate transport protein mae1 n=1 Tax=Phialocephala subalpina TaxID=576137 RepID=A0A1L7X362_9HELO|nr:related to C4-dicarboxylate transport protein mae1 [Phialocephala subalpina]